MTCCAIERPVTLSHHELELVTILVNRRLSQLETVNKHRDLKAPERDSVTYELSVLMGLQQTLADNSPYC